MKRVLVVANEAVESVQLRQRLREHLGSTSAQLIVVVPALTDSALKHYLGDVDEAIDPAKKRLARSLAALREPGFDARGEVGDSDPTAALSDLIPFR